MDKKHYKNLEAMLGASALARDVIDAAFREYAHELAEEIRAEKSRSPFGMSALAAADLIDPEVTA